MNIYVGLLVTFVSVVSTLAAPDSVAQSSGYGVNTGRAVGQISPEIVNELKDFIDLIPTATLDEIIAEHYIIDGDFRHALNYVRSSEFKRLMEKLVEVPQVIEIFQFLHIWENSSSVHQSENQHHQHAPHYRYHRNRPSHLNQIPTESTMQRTPRVYKLTSTNRVIPNTQEMFEPQLEIVLLNGTPAALHSFSSFVEEVLSHLPRDRFTQMITQKCQKSPVFQQFYLNLRSPQLRVMVNNALKAKSLKSFIDTLNTKKVNVDGLVPIAFTVISWGPNI